MDLGVGVICVIAEDSISSGPHMFFVYFVIVLAGDSLIHGEKIGLVQFQQNVCETPLVLVIEEHLEVKLEEVLKEGNVGAHFQVFFVFGHQ